MPATASASWSGVARSSSRALAPDAQREHHQAAEAEGEPDRRGAGEHVVGLGAQHVRRERVGDGQHVAVEVHRRLRPAGGARGEGQQRDVVGGGVDVGERVRLAARPGRPGRRAPSSRRPPSVRPGIAAPLQVLGQPVVAQRDRRAAHLGHRRELAGAQQRHRRHRDAAGLQHGEPAGHQPRLVEPAQQHPVARDQPEVVDEDGGDPVRRARAARRSSTRSRRASAGTGRSGPSRSMVASSSSVAQLSRSP